MVSSCSIKIEGVKEVTIALHNVNKNVIAELRAGAIEGAKIIADKARELAPMGPTGNLKKAIKYKEMPYKETSPIVSIAAVDRKKAPHAHLVEFGTVKSRAHPYFRPAYRQMANRVKQIITEAMKRAISKAGKL